MKHLVLGGVKSGKSRYAETLAADVASKTKFNVALVATAQALDEEMAQRISKHQIQRPDNWVVIEEPVDLAKALRDLDADPSVGVIVIDCLTLWLTNLLVKPEVVDHKDSFISVFKGQLETTDTPCILVSNETNMGLIGMDKLTRDFCDEAGRLHQSLATICDHVSLVVAGLPLSVK
ncbi:hypothetical protein A3762_05795 [Oleiphilus sp. HI0125]|uniref:bifunctional adenosylcobinamide kinase/adenosylcobinamide-phosphate guanylyltransferase n=1 Tax=Oleiphilus sp. HI0125 TaxID=1822266 RepID=UPI0007C39233|nr:bifunctional adenosylcobinamide kinase/adenosylcobinamide-phosphate guanylyltransferase [Oleiphilus sp. HI0125]KZZ59162.1 hypothetical protein A3762_05795 [Oleiphilus sp. HI0125]